MSKIMFRQKTEEELQAGAAEKQKREPAPSKIEQTPSAAEPPAVAAASAFALDGEEDAPKPKKGRRK